MFKKRLTKKRFKKLLMGQYKMSRNEAEGLSNEYPRSIVRKDSKTIINGHVLIFDEPLTLFGTRYLFDNKLIGGDES